MFYSRPMTFEQVIKHFGTEYATAKKLGFSKQAVNKWKTRGITSRTQEFIQLKTRGKLKAEGK